MSKTVGLFGGTFDPVHNGHVQIADSFVQSDLIEELWVLLTPDPPHKTGKTHAPFAHRERMLEAAFADYQNIIVSTIENTLPRPTYTIQTLEFLQKNYPTYHYYLCFGEDSLVTFKKWYRYQDILAQCELLVAYRPGFDSSDIDEAIKAKAHFIEHEPVDISSSQIRERVQKNESIDEYVPYEVAELINEWGLYREDQH